MDTVEHLFYAPRNGPSGGITAGHALYHGLPEFFVKLLTDPGDMVVDFFAGSNTTGSVAERLGRRWASCELDIEYVATSALRFLEQIEDATSVRQRILAGETVALAARPEQLPLAVGS